MYTGITVAFKFNNFSIDFLILFIIGKVENLCKEVPIDDPSRCSHAEEWDGMTLETWKHQTIWTNGEDSIYTRCMR